MLAGPKTLTAEDLGSYLNRLHDELGLEMVGTDGANSVVFKHPTDPNMVVKVSVDDPVYMSFVGFCRRNPANRWVPNVMDCRKLSLDDKEAWAVFMPKLKRATEAQINQAFDNEIAPWANFKHFSTKRRLSYPQWRLVLRMTQDPDMKTLSAFLLRNFRYLDLDRRNFMTRPDGQLVFNDPLASQV